MFERVPHDQWTLDGNKSLAEHSLLLHTAHNHYRRDITPFIQGQCIASQLTDNTPTGRLYELNLIPAIGQTSEFFLFLRLFCTNLP